MEPEQHTKITTTPPPSLPPNYVSLADLQHRWLKQQQKQQQQHLNQPKHEQIQQQKAQKNKQPYSRPKHNKTHKQLKSNPNFTIHAKSPQNLTPIVKNSTIATQTPDGNHSVTNPSKLTPVEKCREVTNLSDEDIKKKKKKKKKKFKKKNKVEENLVGKGECGEEGGNLAVEKKGVNDRTVEIGGRFQKVSINRKKGSVDDRTVEIGGRFQKVSINRWRAGIGGSKQGRGIDNGLVWVKKCEVFQKKV